MTTDYHRAKNVFGELTFGEYWNLSGCHAAVFRVDGCRSLGTMCRVNGSLVEFRVPARSRDEALLQRVDIPLDAPARVAGNRVVTRDSSGGERTIEFFVLSPLDFDPPKKI